MEIVSFVSPAFIFLPPLRQPGLVKYLAGPEIGGGNFMADTMPEEKAAELRKVNPGRV
jgi:galactose-1-phosphate uridylyltransferase